MSKKYIATILLGLFASSCSNIDAPDMVLGDSVKHARIYKTASQDFSSKTLIVHFRDDLRIRTARDSHVVTSPIFNVQKINQILDRYQVDNIYCPFQISEEQAALDASNIKRKLPNLDSGNKLSTAIITFQDGVNLNLVSESLSNTGAVDIIAQPEHNISATVNATASPPVDIEFTKYCPITGSSSAPKNDYNYYHFNRHSVFSGQEYYKYWTGTSVSPKVAVLEVGKFTANPIDSINYDTANSIRFTTDSSASVNPSSDWQISGWTHGGAVAAILGANKNSVGFCGVAPGVSILPISTDGNSLSIAKGIDYALQKGVKIINISIQTSNMSILENDYYVRQAMSSAYSQGATVVLCAGNGRLQTDYNAGIYSNAIVVGALDKYTGSDTNFTNFGTRIDISASGNYVSYASDQVWTDDYINRYSLSDPNYVNTSGTSFAAPQVAGLVSYLRGIDGSLNADQIRRVLSASAVVGPTGGTQMGDGMWDTSKNSVGYGSRMVEFDSAMHMLAFAGYNNRTGYSIRAYNSDDLVKAKHTSGYWVGGELVIADLLKDDVNGGNSFRDGYGNLLSTFNIYAQNNNGSWNYGASILGWKNGDLVWNGYTAGFARYLNPDGTALWTEVPVGNAPASRYFDLFY